MINDSNENNSAAKPDVFSFNHVIKSYLKCAIGGGGDATTTAPRVVAKGLRKKALFAAIDTFNALCQFSTAQPNEQTYIQMLKIVQTLMPEESGERTELCEDFFRKTCESSLLTNAVIRVVENILPESSLKRLEACRTTEVGGDCSSSGGRLTVYCLPEEWSSKRRKGQNQRRGPKRLQRNSRR